MTTTKTVYLFAKSFDGSHFDDCEVFKASTVLNLKEIPENFKADGRSNISIESAIKYSTSHYHESYSKTDMKSDNKKLFSILPDGTVSEVLNFKWAKPVPTLKAGDLVKVIATDAQLKTYHCDKKIITGEVYKIKNAHPNTYDLETVAGTPIFLNNIMPSFVEKFEIK